MKTPHFRPIVATALAAIGLALGPASAHAATYTRTYLFSSRRGGTAAEFTGYLYEQSAPSTHYASSPATWTYGVTASLSFTLANGVTFTFASSSSRISAFDGDALRGQGSVTLTLDGGATYFIHHVTMYDRDGNVVQLDADGQQVPTVGTEPFDYSNGTRTFTKTITNAYITKIVVTYGTEDIHLISDDTTTVTFPDDPYLYTGQEIRPKPVVVCNGATLVDGTHCTRSYTSNLEPGTATVTVEGVAPYHGSVSATFTIRAPALSDFNQLGDGSYEIASETDLDRLSGMVNCGNACAGVTFRQTADIACSGTLTGIGYCFDGSSDARPFSGTYDGQNHVISGLKVENDWRSHKRISTYFFEFYSGLFAYLRDATVRNVRLVNPKVYSEVVAARLRSAYGFANNRVLYVTLSAGAMAGRAESSAIENCFTYSPAFTRLISGSNVEIGSDDRNAIVGSRSNTDTTGSGQVYRARTGENVTFAANGIAAADGFIYDGSRYYRKDAAVALRYTGAAVPAGRTLAFTDASGNALAVTGGGTSYSLAMPARDVTVSAAILPLFPPYLEGADEQVKTNYLAWAATYGADDAGGHEAAFLMNVAPSATPVALRIVGIEVVEGGVRMRITGTAGGAAVDMAQVNGVISVAAGDSLGALVPRAVPSANVTSESGGATVFVPSTAGAFIQAVVGVATPSE